MTAEVFLLLFVFIQQPCIIRTQHFSLHASPTSLSTPFITTQLPITTDTNYPTSLTSPSSWGVTVCSYVRLHYYRKPLSLLLQVLNHTGSPAPLDVTVGVLPSSDLVIRDGGSVYTNAGSATRIPMMEWTHVCLVVAKEFTHTFVGGLLVKGLNVTREEFKGVSVRIGGEKDTDDEKNEEKGNFAGEISYPEVWVEVLPYRDVLEVLSECRQLNMAPATVAWKYSGDVSVIPHRTRGEPCRKSTSELTLVQPKLKFSKAQSFCSNLELNLNDVSTVQKREIVKEFIAKYRGSCFEQGKGAWVEQPVVLPNTTGNACKALSPTAKFQNIPCSSELCAICNIRKNRQLFYLREISSTNAAKLTFIVANDVNSSMYFQGVTGQTIEWLNGRWLLKTGMFGTVLAELQEKEIIGSGVWTIREAWGDRPDGPQVLLTFNSCLDDQWWCSSGTCIASSQRCDNVRDCPDGSDEEDCFSRAAQIASTSVREVHPGNVDVSLEVTVLRLIQSNEDAPLQAAIKRNLMWTDSVTEFPNITSGKTTKLSESFPVWRPVIAPEGVQPPPGLCIGEECENPAVLTVYTQSSPALTAQQSRDEMYRKATLRLSTLSVHSLDCQGQYLTFFPFEEHICDLHFRPNDETYSLTSLSAISPVRYTQHFIVQAVQLRGLKTRDDATAYAKAVLKIHVKRLCGFYVVLVFIPSFFLLMLNSIMLWVHEPQEYRLTTSIFIALSFLLMWLIITTSSPKSSTIRAIDVWMSFTVTHSLLHVIVNTIVRALLVDEEEGPHSRNRSSLSSRPVSRLRQVKPMEVSSLYDAILAKMAKDENENTWTVAYWVMFCARIVSPTLSVLFMVSFWPFVAYYAKEQM